MLAEVGSMMEASTEKDYPLVSIVTPSYNQGKFIEYAILSVKNQSYPNIEHIIVDGKSTDNTLDIIKKYEGKYNLRWISEPDDGQSDAINKGFKMAKGEIIGWINSDDAYFSKNTISEVVNFFDIRSGSQIVYGDIILINAENEIIRINPSVPFFRYESLKIYSIPSQPAVFFKRYIIDKYSLDISLTYGMDYDFWLKIGRENKFFYIKRILSCFRLHDCSKSVSKCNEMDSEIAAVAERYRKISDHTNILDQITHTIRIILPIFSVIDALNLYYRDDFAFDMRLPPKLKIIKNSLLIKEILNKIK
jgi:glycosyltransferase involved in cell wall biosynthesis